MRTILLVGVGLLMSSSCSGGSDPSPAQSPVESPPSTSATTVELIESDVPSGDSDSETSVPVAETPPVDTEPAGRTFVINGPAKVESDD